ncbi:pyridoxamine 5'-phosphate oxidase family protein [Rothia sp. ARF10]|nr:pyridoxamine 5'-phosphate oxidase family protein [Rothia sp. ARF10]
MDTPDLVEHAHALLEQNRYVTLGSVGRDGRPWTSPVYFAADGLADYWWVSSESSRHSANLAARPDVSLVVFDSTVPAYHGRALYAVGLASVVSDEGLARGLEVYPGPGSRGGSAITVEDVTGGSPWRLWHVRADEVWVLCPRDPRQPCPLHGRTDDHRERVHPLP